MELKRQLENKINEYQNYCNEYKERYKKVISDEEILKSKFTD